MRNTCRYEKHKECLQNGEVCPFCGPAGAESASHLTRKGGRPPKVSHLPGANLFLGSNPQPGLPLFDHTVDGKRKIHCRRYENCLKYAMKMNWISFECLDCSIDETMSKDDWKRDLEGLADLLRAIIG